IGQSQQRSQYASSMTSKTRPVMIKQKAKGYVNAMYARRRSNEGLPKKKQISNTPETKPSRPSRIPDAGASVRLRRPLHVWIGLRVARLQPAAMQPGRPTLAPQLRRAGDRVAVLVVRHGRAPAGGVRARGGRNRAAAARAAGAGDGARGLGAVAE